MRYSTKETLSISTEFLNKHHCFEENSHYANFESTRIINGQKVKSTVPFGVVMEKENESIYFQDVKVNEEPVASIRLFCMVSLVSTPCQFGGRRWWFLCPQITNGKTCNKRVGILYLPDIKGKTFGCRHCHKLRYISSKRSNETISTYD